MVKRQPGRPTEQEFLEAASRFLDNDYPTDYVLMWNIPVSRRGAQIRYDRDIIRREWQAEGKIGDVETLGQFATRQRDWYELHKNSPGSAS